MVFVLKGTAGPYQNKLFKLGVGMSLGRRQGDILLEHDSTISSLHGRVISTPNGGLALQDAGSQNQFLLFGKKVAHIDLAAGVIFQVGQCIFQVLAVSEKELASMNLEKNWKEVVFDTLAKNRGIQVTQPMGLSPTVTLECIQGPSAETTWFLGFGPRLFGPLSPDIEFLEEDAPDVAFEIAQGDMGPTIRAIKKNILVNSRSVSEKSLEDEDKIQVGSTIFKVRLGS